MRIKGYLVRLTVQFISQSVPTFPSALFSSEFSPQATCTVRSDLTMLRLNNNLTKGQSSVSADWSHCQTVWKLCLVLPGQWMLFAILLDTVYIPGGILAKFLKATPSCTVWSTEWGIKKGKCETQYRNRAFSDNAMRKLWGMLSCSWRYCRQCVGR